jgi:hypothetical protein
MSHTKHLLSIMPLMAILALSPMQLVKAQSTTEQSKPDKPEVKQPLFEARAAKIDRSKLTIDPEINLEKLSAHGEAYRTKLLELRKNYQVKELDKDKVEAQKKSVQESVDGLVLIEEEVKVLMSKAAWDIRGEEIIQKTLGELRDTVESLLKDEIENEKNVKIAADEEAKKKADEEAKKKEEEKKKVAEEEGKKKEDEQPKKEEEVANKGDDKKEKEDKSECDKLAEQNQALQQQMTNMTQQMMAIMQNMQQMQLRQMYSYPGVNPMLQYPYYQPTANNIFIIGSGSTPMLQQPGMMNYGQNNPMGQGVYNQYQNGGQFQMPGPQIWQGGYDPRFASPTPNMGTFNGDPSMFNFGGQGHQPSVASFP